MIEHLLTLFQTNPVFQGMVGAGLIGGLLFQIRALPGYLWSLFTSQCVLTLTVHHDDPVFRKLAIWLARHPDGKKSRRVTINMAWDPQKEDDVAEVTPGPGLHLFKENGRHFLIHREIKQPGNAESPMMHRTETMTIRTIGRDQRIIKDLVDKAAGVFEDKTAIPIYLATQGGYHMAGRRTKRPLDSIDMDVEQKARIVDRLQTFLASRQDYAAKAIPWRLGVLLEGPPGTGKTSLIFALASMLGRPVHLINPAIMETDAQFQAAISQAGSGIVVIEDIDSCKAVLKRKVSETGEVEADTQATAGKGLTLSGILNAIDGIASHEGRVLFVTSNCADALDDAMLRPGRIDVREYIDLMNHDAAVSMFRRLCPTEDAAAFAAQVDAWLPASPAQMQEWLLSGKRPHSHLKVAA